MAVALFILFSWFELSASPLSRKILLLHSYHKGVSWTDGIDRSVRDYFENHEGSYTIYTEYMDTKRFNLADVEPSLKTHLKRKYSFNKPDIIITSDNNALEFVRNNREELFRGVPVVFCGVNEFDPQEIEHERGITGVVESLYYKDTIDLLLTLHPETERILCIVDETLTGRIHRRKILKLRYTVDWNVQLDIPRSLSAEEVANLVKNADDKTVILYLAFFRDVNGVLFSDHESMKLILDNTRRPVYSLWDFTIGMGAVGGVVISSRQQGQFAAKLALDILKGKSPDAIPVITESPNEIFVDYKIISKYGVDPKNIPKGVRLLNSPHSFYNEYRTQVWIVFSAFIFLLLLIIVLGFNIWQRHRTQEKLRFQRELLNDILSNIPQYVFWKNGRGEYLGCNENFALLAGQSSSSDIIGRKDNNMPWDEMGYHHFQRIGDEVTSTGKGIFNEEVFLNFPDGRLAAFLISMVPLINRHGDVEIVLGLALDISDRKQMENQLQQAQKMEAIGRLAGGIAHDFNNLLAGIIGNNELINLELDRDIKLQELIGDHVANIFEASARAADHIKQLLTFARKRSTEKDLLDAHELIRASLKILGYSLGKNIILETHFHAGKSMVMGELSQLQNVIINLGINAGDSMPDGGTIRFTTKDALITDSSTGPASTATLPNGRYIEITVEDSGAGMPSDVQKYIFEPFYTTKGEKGTGLGLSTVYNTINSHNGSIFVESVYGQGTIFTIYLPLAEMEDLAEDDAVTTKCSLNFYGGTVLIVDDEAQVLNSTREILADKGYCVLTASDGEEAVDLFQAYCSEIDIVILDYLLPRMRGDQVLEKIRSICPDVNVIFITGQMNPRLVERLESLDVVKIVSKPYRFDEMLRIISSVLESTKV
jgi:two-component system cell cycle sensor histidine kinase/response regulator CckA